jgi:hypothetical protein
MIHTTARYYPNGDCVTNGVRSEDLVAHIWYCIHMTPGCALMVDGIFLTRGNFCDQQLAEVELLYSRAPDYLKKFKICTAPYK